MLINVNEIWKSDFDASWLHVICVGRLTRSHYVENKVRFDFWARGRRAPRGRSLSMAIFFFVTAESCIIQSEFIITNGTSVKKSSPTESEMWLQASVCDRF